MATLVVPAAGEGSRLGGDLPKALVELGSRPLIDWVVRAARESASHIVVVIQPRHQQYFEEWAEHTALGVPLTWAFQETPSGSLSAVRIGLDRARQSDLLEPGVVIVWSDQVGVSSDTIARVSQAIASDDAVLAVPLRETPSPYVWVELDDAMQITRVLRARDGDTPPQTGLADLGVFGLSAALARHFLETPEEFSSAGMERELDFTYALPALSARADVTVLPRIGSESELVAVNTPEDLARAREVLGEGR